jgi:hypothetical protein
MAGGTLRGANSQILILHLRLISRGCENQLIGDNSAFHMFGELMIVNTRNLGFSSSLLYLDNGEILYYRL